MKLSSQKRNAIFKLLVLDYFTAIIAWVIFWIHRHNLLASKYPNVFVSEGYMLRDWIFTIIVVPAFWIFIYYIGGTYFDVYRKSRLMEIYRTILTSFIGVMLIGIVGFANDTDSFKYFFGVTIWYFIVHTFLVLVSRILYFKKTKTDLIKGAVTYNTLIIGENGKATKVLHELTQKSKIKGYKIVGLVSPTFVTPNLPEQEINYLGTIESIKQIVREYKVDEVVIALDSSNHNRLEDILIRLSNTSTIVKVMPDMYDIISGSVRTSNVLDAVFLTINPELLPDWQKVCKRAIDVIASSFAIFCLSPIYIFAAIKVKRSSEGPIFYKQERIGLNGIPFKIIKFRSMFTDAEKHGPALSSDKDSRITPWGKVMRKWRIDELPQFFNVLKGEMSLVGPRPERQHYIDIISETNPQYHYLHRVKPGITSWGMVQYGYAENTSQMIERMKYDLLYIQNCSLALDIKIMIFTLKVLFEGRGK